MGYRIKTVSEITGIPKNTLVAWERRYGILAPDRLPNGYRQYNDDDIAILLQLKRAMADGLKISEAVELVRRGRGRNGGQAKPPASLLASSPALRDQLVGMLLRAGCGPRDGTHVACTTFPGEQHELRVLGLAVKLALAGCRVTYLGSDPTVEELCRFARAQEPAWICVSVVDETRVGTVTSFAKALRRCTDGVELVIGGVALNGMVLPDLPGVTFIEDWSELSIS